MKNELLSALTFSAALAAFGGIVAYQEYPKEIERDYAYAVRVSQGDERRRLVVYNHCEKGAGMLNVFTDAFLEQGGGIYRLSFEARAKGNAPADLEALFLSNEKKIAERLVVPCDGEWHGFEEKVDLDFDVAATELVALHLKTAAPTDELCFKNLSLIKETK